MSTLSSKHRSAGFTLIELMVTVAIVSILATIAVTTYTTQIQKSRRTEAKTALLDLAGREERLFSTTNAYTDQGTALGYSGGTMTNFPFGNGYYALSVVLTTTGTPPVPTGYTLTASPVAGQSQANDTKCAAFSVNQLGVQTISGTGTASGCWGD
jgi:type IV pilus assembly protein PilE